MSDSALLIFIKNAEKGKVKTRLAQSVGDDKALQIYQALLGYTRSIALNIDADRLLFYSNFVDQNDAWPNDQFHKLVQTGSDLGARMQQGFVNALAKHQKAVIIGSDCATLTVEIVQQAFQALDQYDYVIGPAQDGGYYLLGMSQPSPSLFEDMAWSTDQVLPTTLNRIQQLQRNYFLLPELSDIDYAEDWEKYGWEV